MKMYIKLLSAVVMTAVFVLTSCSKEHGDSTLESDQISFYSIQTSAKSGLGKQGEISMAQKEDLQNILRSIAVLSKIEYPVKDIDAFKKALSPYGGAYILKIFEESYTKSDFPLHSFKTSFKAHYFNNFLFSPIRPIFPNLPSFDPELPDEPRNEPSVCDVLKHENFGPEATDCGCRTYIAAIRSGFNHYQATIQAVFAALDYDPIEGCNLDD